jgi:hypothetical protein
MMSNRGIHESIPWPPHAHCVMSFWFHECLHSHCNLLCRHDFMNGSQYQRAPSSLHKVSPMSHRHHHRIHDRQILCPWRHCNLPPSSAPCRINILRHSLSLPSLFQRHSTRAIVEAVLLQTHFCTNFSALLTGSTNQQSSTPLLTYVILLCTMKSSFRYM